MTPPGATPIGKEIDPAAPTAVPLPVAPGDPTRPVGKAARFEDPVPPAKIGRFTVLREIGRGGTGVVYAAYDEQLDRKVAVKLLHSETREDVARARLLREAQAMARLSHPNIVGVHEVGTFGRQIYVAMEFVHGMTLHAWLKRQRRSFAEIVRVFRQAGEGLAAAHEAGLVHRDFKPANAMLGDDGRVRVLDFGLARAEAEPGAAPGLGELQPAPPEGSAVANLRSLDASITVTGMMLGTPAYMSPEQFLGVRVDARSDQFALCVALFEAVYRERPFAGDTLAELMSAVLAGQVREPPPAPGVPRALRPVLLRGLRRRPEDRWPTLRALLAELDRVARPPARRAWLSAAALATALGAAGFGMAYQTGLADQVCSGGAEQIAAAWNPERRARLAAAMRASGIAEAEAAWEHVAAQFDSYADDWVVAYADACAATEVRKQQTPDELDLRMNCLNERRHALDAALEVFQRPDAQVVARAGAIAAQLPWITTCADVAALGQKVRPPEDPAIRAEVEEIRQDLQRVEVHERAGGFAEALALLDSLAPPAGYLPLHAEIALRRGSVLEHDGRYLDARKAMTEAFFPALEAGHYKVAIDAATRLAYIVGRRLGDAHTAEDWLRHAEVYSERFGDVTQQARAATVRGALANFADRLADAEAALNHALDLYGDSGAEDKVGYARTMRFYGDMLANLGRVDEAIAAEEQALTLMQSELGEHHPDVAMVHNSLGLAFAAAERPEDAIKTYRAGLDAAVDLEGQRNHIYFTLWANTGYALRKLGREMEAEEAMRASIEVLERSSERLLADTYSMRIQHAEVLSALGRDEEAEQALRDLLARAELTWGARDCRLAEALKHLSRTRLRAGAADEALALAERAYALAQTGTDPLHEVRRHDVAFTLARALVGAGEDRTRALRLARESRAFSLGRLESATPEKAADLRKWLAEVDAFLAEQSRRGAPP